MATQDITQRAQPGKYSPTRVALVLDDLASGLTLSAACQRAGIHPTAWEDWLEADASLADAYGRARKIGHDVLADQCIAIADGELPCALDYIAQVDAQRMAEAMSGKPMGVSSQITRLLAGAGLEIARDRMRIDTRLKLLAQWDQRYSPKQHMELTGKDGGPIQLEDKGDAIALSTQLREMKRARLARGAPQVEHQPRATGEEDEV